MVPAQEEAGDRERDNGLPHSAPLSHMLSLTRVRDSVLGKDMSLTVAQEVTIMNKIRVRGTHSVPCTVSALRWDLADPFMRLAKSCFLELKDEKMADQPFQQQPLLSVAFHISQPQAHRTTATTLDQWQASA